jgi:iron(III) transport system substrate-binding protein
MKGEKMKKLLLKLVILCVAVSVGFVGWQKDVHAAEYDDLVVYTNSGGEGRAEWITEVAAEQGFKIQVVHAGGGDTANRLIAEKNNPIADVVFGLSILNYEDFKSKDMLVKHVPPWADEVDSTMKDAEGYYHGIVKQAIVLVYNPEVYTEENAPKDWPDLWHNPEFHGKYSAFGLGGMTSRMVLLGIAMRYLDPEGELGISDEGWKEIAQYVKHAYWLPDGEDFTQNLIDKKVPLMMLWGSGVIDRQKQYDFTFGIMVPEIGIPYVVEQVAILNGTENLESAKAFVDWFGTAEVQAAWAQQFGTSPANKIAMESASEEARALDALLSKSQPIDWAIVQKNIELWVEKIELEYME